MFVPFGIYWRKDKAQKKGNSTIESPQLFFPDLIMELPCLQAQF